MMGPEASTEGLARRSSSASATSKSFSSSSSRLSRCLAETSANCVVPPHSSGCRPSVANSERTRSRLAFGTSILLTATTIGTPAARACEIDSRVCGMTPSSAGDDEDRDIGDLRTAGAHGSKRLVPRGIDQLN